MNFLASTAISLVTRLLIVQIPRLLPTVAAAGEATITVPATDVDAVAAVLAAGAGAVIATVVTTVTAAAIAAVAAVAAATVVDVTAAMMIVIVTVIVTATAIVTVMMTVIVTAIVIVMMIVTVTVIARGTVIADRAAVKSADQAAITLLLPHAAAALVALKAQVFFSPTKTSSFYFPLF